MVRVPVPATPGMFRNPLAPAAAVFLGLGSLMGLGSILCLFDPGYLAALTEKIIISGIRTSSALRTWTWMHIVISVICGLSPAVVVWSMIQLHLGQAAKSMNRLSNIAHILRILLRILGYAAIAVFILRFSRYLISISRRQDWLYQLFATVIMEALMVSLTVFLYKLLCRFLEECEGCTASIGYTLSSGYLDPGSVPAFVASGLTALAILGLVLSADRMVTMTIASDGFQQYYKFVWSVHPGQWLCAGSLFFGAIGDFLLGAYLRFYKRISERTVFYATRKK